ncbi:MAG: transporter substrate-binding domain-containing protein [Ruminococcaceae bacterium]|nr:transporter substrate-binding domain-containing protein [Oscillospiraceae bacterium]
MKKIIAAVLCLVLVLACVGMTSCKSAAEKQSVDAIKKAGVLTMYTNAEFPPFEYMKGTEVKGVDVDIAQAIADKLGVELEIKNVKFDTIIGSIQSGKGSIGAAGITVTEERKESVDFSIEYTTSKQYIIVPTDSTVAKIEDLAGMKIGVQLGTTGDFIITDEINGYESDGEQQKGVLQDTGASVVTYNSAADAAIALNSGKIGAVVIDKLPAEIVAGNYDNLKAIELVYADGSNTEESYAICVAKGNESLLKVINEVIEELKASGKIDEFIITHTGAAS